MGTIILIVFFFSEKCITSVPVFVISLFKILTYAVPVIFVLQLKQEGRLLSVGAVIDIVHSLALLVPFYLWMGSVGAILLALISYGGKLITSTVSEVALYQLLTCSAIIGITGLYLLYRDFI